MKPAACDDYMTQWTTVAVTLLCTVCAGRCRNWDNGTCRKRQTKNQKFLVCQQGLLGAEIWTLRPWGRPCVVILD